MEAEGITSQPAQSRRTKRSRTVCYRCHEKKIRCDLKLVSSLPLKYSQCSYCDSADVTCVFRPSQKGKRLKKKRSGAPEISQSHQATAEFAEQALASAAGAESLGILSPSAAISNAIYARGNVENDDNASRSFANDTDGNQATQTIDRIPPALQQGNIETFLEMGYPWFPIVDVEDKALGVAANKIDSLLLQHALALFAGRLREPLRPHASPEEHYRRARELMYSDPDVRPLDRIRAAILLHWCTSSQTETSSIDNSFWWSGVAIRLAQDAGLHREPKAGHEQASVKRRIWWTIYARDRLISLQQGRPSTINDDFCDVLPPTLADFPSDKTPEAQIFTNWVRLSVIMGRVHKILFTSRRTGVCVPTVAIAEQLTEWVNATHPLVPLPISKDRTVSFDRDVHLLYLPYLTTISLVYLNTSKNKLPQASVPAVIAASCVARIFEDFSARGSLRFISEQSGWFIAIAILSLLHVRALEFLRPQATTDLNLLRTALKHTASIWPSARSLDAGIERLLGSDARSNHNDASSAHPSHHYPTPSPASSGRTPSFLEDLCAGDGVQWARFFPFVTNQTSSLIDIVLTECRSSFPELWLGTSMSEDWTGQFNELLEIYGSLPLDESFALSGRDWDLQV